MKHLTHFGIPLSSRLNTGLIIAFLGMLTAGSALASELSVTIDVFSGRPNPTITVEDIGTSAYLEEALSGASSLTIVSDEEKRSLDALGYRGVVISRQKPGAETIVKAKNGLLRVTNASGVQYYRDDANLEGYFIRLMANSPEVSELVAKSIIPDPMSMEQE